MMHSPAPTQTGMTSHLSKEQRLFNGRANSVAQNEVTERIQGSVRANRQMTIETSNQVQEQGRIASQE